MNKVSIIGAGNVGATAAMKIAELDMFDRVVLLDILHHGLDVLSGKNFVAVCPNYLGEMGYHNGNGVDKGIARYVRRHLLVLA